MQPASCWSNLPSLTVRDCLLAFCCSANISCMGTCYPNSRHIAQLAKSHQLYADEVGFSANIYQFIVYADFHRTFVYYLKVNETILKSIVTNPDRDYFHAKDFDSLPVIIDKLVADTCRTGACPTPSVSTTTPDTATTPTPTPGKLSYSCSFRISIEQLHFGDC